MRVTLIENTTPMAVVKATAMPYQCEKSLAL